MNYRMKLVQVVEKYFEFEAPDTDDLDEIFVAAWHALDEDNVVFTQRVKTESIEPADDCN